MPSAGPLRTAASQAVAPAVPSAKSSGRVVPMAGTSRPRPVAKPANRGPRRISIPLTEEEAASETGTFGKF
jgi:hypothetical protein